MEGIPNRESTAAETPGAIIERMETELNNAQGTLSEIAETGHLNNDSVGVDGMNNMERHIRLLAEELVKLKEILKPSETEN